MASLTTARENLAQEVERVIPPDDPLHGLLEGLVRLTAALEAAETRISADATDRLARAAAYGAQTHTLALVRLEARKWAAWISLALALALAVGVAMGWMLARA